MKCVLQIGGQDLDRQPALREQNQLQVVLQEFERDAARFGEIRAANPELRVDDRRIDEQEELLTPRRAVLFDQLEWTARQPLGQLARVGDRRRRADEDRIGSVMAADRAAAAGGCSPRWLPNTPRYACSSSMMTKRRFSNSFAHRGWCGRIPECTMSGLLSTTCALPANRAPRIRRRVAVVCEHADLQIGAVRDQLGQRVQLGELILRERLRRKQIERARRRSPAGSRSARARCNRASFPTPSA